MANKKTNKKLQRKKEAKNYKMRNKGSKKKK